jgi:hypothetical protein
MSYTSVFGAGPQTPLGELQRIGDIIQQEEENYRSRRICTLKASQGAIKKGQVLGGDFTVGATAGDLYLLGANEVQTIVLGTAVLSAGTYALRFVDYQGAVRITPLINFGDSSGTVQTAIDSAFGAANCAVVGSYVAGTASTAGSFTLTFSGTNYAGKSQTLVAIDVIAALTGDSGGDIGTVTRTTGVDATVIALQTLSNVAAVQNILCLVRQATVKPYYLSYGANRTTAALAVLSNKALEKNSAIVVLGGPTYNLNPDATDSVYDADNGYITQPSGIPGV